MTLQLWAEALALPLFLAGAALWRGGPARRRENGLLAQVARRPLAAVSLAAIAGLAAAAVPTVLFGPPIPQSHDEFCYLLQAQTFAAGRLTNPTPPLAEHFESPHLLLHPTYTGKYHPAQGLVLAAGLAATGSVVVGLWLQVALLGAALGWMLRQWLAPRWALVTSLVAVVWCGAATYWGYSYWGGCVPAAGGALVLGGARSLAKRPSRAGGALLGLGLAVLAASRPFEGGLLSLVALGWLAFELVRRRTALRATAGSAGVALIVLATAGAGMLLYNEAVTGDPWLMPYLLYERNADATPLFLWQAPGVASPTRHPELARYWQLHFTQWESQRTPSGWLRGAWANLRKLARFFLGPALWLPLLALPLRSSPARLAALGTLAVVSGVLVIGFCVPHYAAPATASVVACIALGLRRLRRWRWRGRPLGVRLAAGALAASLGVLPIGTLALGEERRGGWGRERFELTERLRALPGDDLVFVHFGGAMIDPGWIYNEPELDRAPTIWARSIGPREDCQLIARFPGRSVWRVGVGAGAAAVAVESPAGSCAGLSPE